MFKYYVVTWSEVCLVLMSNTWLEWSTTRVALHNIARSKTLYLRVEGMGRRYILEGLPHRCLCEPRGISYNLGCLPSGGISERPEVRALLWIARLTRSSAYVPCHVPSPG